MIQVLVHHQVAAVPILQLGQQRLSLQRDSVRDDAACARRQLPDRVERRRIQTAADEDRVRLFEA